MLRTALAYLLAVLLLVAGPATAAPLGIDDMMRVPDFAQPQLSDSGRYLAVLSPVKRDFELNVIDLETRKPVSRIAVPGADISSFVWLGDEFLLFSLERFGTAMQHRNASGGLFLISRDGAVRRKLLPTVQEWFATGARRYVHFGVVHIPPGQQEYVLVAGNQREEHTFDLYRLDVQTVSRRLLTPDAPQGTRRWLVDAQGAPRVAEALDSTGLVHTTWFREADGKPWRELW